MKKEGKYKLKVHCSNCEMNGEIEIERGIKIKGASIRDIIFVEGEPVECPKCGCYTLGKRFY